MIGAEVVDGINERLPLSTGRNRVLGISDDLPEIIEIDIAHVQPNPDQPRKHFDDPEIETLAKSIEEHGLLHPITVTAHPEEPDLAVLVSGERRLRACQKLGRTTIWAIFTTGRTDEIALIENLQRVDLDPLELADALVALQGQRNYSQDDIARIIGKSKATVSRIFKVASLPALVRSEYVTLGTDQRPSLSILEEIAYATQADHQEALWTRAKSGASRAAIRLLREKLEAAQGADSSRTPSRPVAKALLGLQRHVSSLAKVNAPLEHDDRQRLEAIRADIDRLLTR